MISGYVRACRVLSVCWVVLVVCWVISGYDWCDRHVGYMGSLGMCCSPGAVGMMCVICLLSLVVTLAWLV